MQRDQTDRCKSIPTRARSGVEGGRSYLQQQLPEQGLSNAGPLGSGAGNLFQGDRQAL